MRSKHATSTKAKSPSKAAPTEQPTGPAAWHTVAAECANTTELAVDHIIDGAHETVDDLYAASDAARAEIAMRLHAQLRHLTRVARHGLRSLVSTVIDAAKVSR